MRPDIKNHEECDRMQAELDALKEELRRSGCAQVDILKAAALEESILIYNGAVLCGFYYHEAIMQAVAQYTGAGGKLDDLFVCISHGIDDELHPHCGCLIQLSYYSAGSEGGIEADEYLFTGLIPHITKATYKELLRFLRSNRIDRHYIGDTFGESGIWDLDTPVTERLARLRKFQATFDREQL